jgi:glycosyltransferase involved in cell wall biosynthesis
MGERVRFFGHQPAGARFVNAADWLVLPSNDEGLPLSILEAYRAGVPVIGSNIPEIAEVVVPGQTGFLFEGGSLDSLLEKLRIAAELSPGERLQMGECAKALWRERYSLDRMLDGYAQIYRELLAARTALR